MKLLSKALLLIYVLTLVWLVLFKLSLDLPSVFDQHIRSITLTPFTNFSGGNARGTVNNLIVFIPLGLLLSVNFKRSSFWRRFLFVFSFSLSAELVQYVFAIGRTDITDIIMNTSGGILGLGLYEICRTYIRHEKLDQYVVSAVGVMVILLFGVLFSYLTESQSAPLP